MSIKFIKTTWLIKAKTNLHVGDECSTGYGLIDKSVQRDALMKLPCINSSSLKGALNEYCTHEDKLNATQRTEIFGSDKKGNKNSPTKKGNTLFFDAHILFLPVQDDRTLFRYVTSEGVIKRLKEQCKLFSGEITISEINENNKTFSLNGIEAEVLSDKIFNQRCSDDELPIIARNVLDNGESKNLWYEQVIPPETIFYTFMQSPEGILENGLKDGSGYNGLSDKLVQIGANATIGYGYCKFSKI
jgi:CRISPR-associated protein Cmr4